jgi:hypothetical protein
VKLKRWAYATSSWACSIVEATGARLPLARAAAVSIAVCNSAIAL